MRSLPVFLLSLFFLSPYLHAQTAEELTSLKDAALKGDASAQIKLGNLLRIGKIFPKDEIQAASWFRKAADQGNAEAQCIYGMCLSFAIGVERNQKEAVSYYRKAATQDYALGQVMLGVCYLEGNGIAMDPVQAFALFMKTKDQAYGSGLMGLFRCYDKGLGIPKNEVEAYAYLTQPAIRLSLKAEGVPEDDFEKSVAKYEKKLTAEQITAGKIRAKEIEKEIEAKIASRKARK